MDWVPPSQRVGTDDNEGGAVSALKRAAMFEAKAAPKVRTEAKRRRDDNE